MVRFACRPRDSSRFFSGKRRENCFRVLSSSVAIDRKWNSGWKQTERLDVLSFIHESGGRRRRFNANPIKMRPSVGGWLHRINACHRLLCAFSAERAHCHLTDSHPKNIELLLNHLCDSRNGQGSKSSVERRKKLLIRQDFCFLF